VIAYRLQKTYPQSRLSEPKRLMNRHPSLRSARNLVFGISLLAVANLLFLPAAVARPATEVDRVVAVVNKEVITAVELRERSRQAARQLERQGVELPPAEVLERQVLERLIVERAQFQYAEETGLRITDAMLERAVGRIAENNGLSEAELRSALAADGISWDRFRSQIRAEMLFDQLREREVESRITVTDAEVDNFLASTPDAFSGTEALIAHILLRAPESPTQQDLARLSARADEIMKLLTGGEDFGKVAASYSDAPDAVQGGLIGWRSADRLPALFAEAVQGLKPGELAPVLRSPAGLHIVKLVDFRRGGTTGAERQEQTRASHILLRTSEVLSDTEAQARLIALRERIVNGESFADLARAHSADLSAAKGGELGWILQGDTVPEFERAMNALGPGEVSQPVRSPFGWHLIQVHERRMQDVSGERKRNAARNALRERKASEAYEEWVRELRDSTYVEYRIEQD